MARLHRALEKAMEADAKFSRGTARASSSNRLASLGDSLLFFLDDECSLFMTDVSAISGVWTVRLSERLQGAEAILASAGERLLAAWGPGALFVIEVDPAAVRRGKELRVFKVGEEMFSSRPGLKIMDVKWHPRSSGHLTMLTSNSTFWIYDISKSTKVEEQKIYLADQRESMFVSFCFSSSTASSWEQFTLYLASREAGIFALCPVAPYGMTFSSSTAHTLMYEAKSTLRSAGQDGEEPGNEDESTGGAMFDDGEMILGANESTSFFSEPSLGARARRKLDFQRSQEEGGVSLAMGSFAGDNPWWLQQAQHQLQWLQDCVYLKEGVSRAVVRPPSESSFLKQHHPLLQGPMHMQSESRAADQNDRPCESISMLDTNSPVIFRSVRGNRLDVLLAIENIEPRWRLHNGEPQFGKQWQGKKIDDDEDDSEVEDEDARAGHDTAPSLLMFEQIQLPGFVETSPSADRSPGKLNEVGKVVATSGKRAEPVALICCSVGLLCLRMPWIAALEAGDADAVNESSSSILSALIATEDTIPLGGAAMFGVPEGTMGVILDSSGGMYAASMAKSMRDWGAASTPGILKPRGIGSSREVVLKPTNFERQLATLLTTMPSPLRFAKRDVQQQDIVTIMEQLQKRVFILHDGPFRAFAQLHSLITERAQECKTLTSDQLLRMKDLEIEVQACQDISDSAQAKLRKCLKQQENLKARVSAVMQIISDGSSRLSRAEQRLASDYKLRQKEMDVRNTQIQELKMAAKIVAEAAEARKKERAPTHPGEVQAPLRSIDQAKIHKALEDHSAAIEVEMRNNDKLVRGVRKLGIGAAMT